MAGESASEVARRKREKAERLLHDADMWDKGAAGEQATARALTVLPPAEWTVLHDVRWPGRRFANIDHVVVGVGGVFVIDSKNWSGRVEVRDGVLRQNGHRREREVAGVADSALAVAEAVSGLDPRLVKPVLCLVTHEQVVAQSHEVMVCSTATLAAQLLAQPVVLDPAAVRRTVGQLHRALASASARPTPTTPSRRNRTPVSAPAPPAAARPLARSRAPERPAVRRERRAARPLLVVAGLGIAGLFLSGIVAGVAGTLGNAIAGAAGPSSPSGMGAGGTTVADALELGQTQRFPRATGRPPLEVTPDRIVTTRAMGTAPYLYPGNRLVAVRVSIANKGARAWSSQPGTTWALVNELGVPHRQSEPFPVAAGEALPQPLRVGPGKTVRGWMVFQADASSPLTSLSLQVGPGQARSATWTIDRQ